MKFLTKFLSKFLLMSLLKKNIAGLMAFIMITSLVIINSETKEIDAASSYKYQLDVKFDNKLVTGSTNSIPLFIGDGTGSLTGGEALIEWNPNILESGAYLLQYPLNNHKVAQFMVKRYVDKAVVTYDIFDPSGNADKTPSGDWIYKDPVSNPSGENYYVHSQLGASSGQEHYVRYDNFQNIDISFGYYVEQHNFNSMFSVSPSSPAPPPVPPMPPTPPVYPQFYINKGQGFSFKFENQTIHFLWESITNKFYFMTDSFEQSRIYPVKLFLSDNLNVLNFGDPSKINVLTGIAEKNITSDALSKGRDKNYTLKHTGNDNENPAEDPNLMRIRINIPEVWVEPVDNTGMPTGGGIFEYGNSIQDPIELKLLLSSHTSRVQVIIDNIFNPTAKSSVSPFAFYGSVPSRKGGNNPGDVQYIEFTLGKEANLGLPYGLLYEGVINFNPTSSTSGIYAFNINKIEYGKFYTFMKYSIVFIGYQYYAIVEPYIGYKGYYRLMVDGSKSVTVYSEGVNPIYMPLVLDKDTGFIQDYQIWFSPGVTFESDTSLRVESQKMKYEAGPQALSIGIANNFEILSHRYIPLDENSGDPDKGVKGTLKLELRWDIAREDTIKSIVDNSANNEIVIKYDIYSTLEPYATFPDGSPDTSKTTLLDTISLTIAKDVNRYSVTYSDTEGMLSSDVPLTRYFTGPDLTNMNDSRIEPPVNDLIYRAYMILDTVAFNKNAITNTVTNPSDVDFYYPNIFFLNTAPTELATYENDNANPGQYIADIKRLSIGESLYASMTLDDYSKLELPQPQNLLAYDPVIITENVNGQDVTRELSLNVKWTVPGEKLREYFDNTQPYEYKDITFSLFMSQSENDLKKLPLIKNPELRVNPPPEANLSVAAVDFHDVFDTSTSVMYFSDIHDGQTNHTAPKFDFGNGMKNLRDYLRSGKVVCITNIPISIDPSIVNSIINGNSREISYKLDGLDKNQKYYFSADMKVEYYNYANPAASYPIGYVFVFPGDYKFIKKEYSKITNIVSELTQGDESKPLPEDKFPPAPVLSKDNVTLSSADILWNNISETNSGNNTVTFDYEIIRTKNTRIDTKLLDSKEKFEEIYKQINITDKTGLKTSAGYIFEYVNGTFSAVASNKYVWDTSQSPMRLTDSSLSPNQLYFYYVRTVRTVQTADGSKTLYSVWSAISVTTTPVKPPKNLSVLRGAQVIPYDRKREFLISFDAPLTDLSKLGSELNIEYSIRTDNGDFSEPYTIPVDELLKYSSSSSETGYTNFKYKVSRARYDNGWNDLKSGETYEIRVRIFDILNSDASVYSNTDTARTEIDQTEKDKEDLEDKWSSHLQDELMKLIKEYYWYACNNWYQTTVVYRPELFKELLTQSEGSALRLVPTDSYTTVYYLPASAVLSANESGKGFKIINRDIEILIPPNAIDTNYNDAINKIGDKIKGGDINDYYIRITLERNAREYFGPGNGLTDTLTISFEAVGSLIDSRLVDEMIFEALMNKILSAPQDNEYLDRIKDVLNNDDKNAVSDASYELVRVIADIVEDIKDDFSDEVDEILSDNTNTVYSINNLAASMLIRFTNAGQDTAVKGYRFDGRNWIVIDTTLSGGVYTISSITPGTFIFAGTKLDLPGLDKIAGSADITAIIVKYGLDDFLGKGNAFNLNAELSGQMVAGIAARLMGAGKTADSYAFLKSKGYILSTRTNTAPISKQESIYLFMAVYEVRTNTKIASIKINNFAQTAGVKNLSDKYKHPVRVAYQLGICNDKSMDASSFFKTDEILTILLRLKSKAGL